MTYTSSANQLYSYGERGKKSSEIVNRNRVVANQFTTSHSMYLLWIHPTSTPSTIPNRTKSVNQSPTVGTIIEITKPSFAPFEENIFLSLFACLLSCLIRVQKYHELNEFIGGTLLSTCLLTDAYKWDYW